VGGSVEVFGSGREGLIYFVADITSKNGNVLKIKYPEDFKDIQRREYSRVSFGGNIKFLDMPENETKSVDISAGGLKFLTSEKLEEGHAYNVLLSLSNLEINCAVEPIRVREHEEDGKKMYLVSGKFLNIESVDRIALIQYTFRILLESENKG
jgi:c-di-GMP-binding flagellar brake protein YcgR